MASVALSMQARCSRWSPICSLHFRALSLLSHFETRDWRSTDTKRPRGREDGAHARAARPFNLSRCAGARALWVPASKHVHKREHKHAPRSTPRTRRDSASSRARSSATSSARCRAGSKVPNQHLPKAPDAGPGAA